MKLMPHLLTNLAENPEYFDEVISLIEREFHYSGKHSFVKDFAPLVNPLNFENCFFMIDEINNKVISHLALCPRIMTKNNSEIKVGLIGGIATHKDYRHQGLFKKLMDHALEQNKDSFGLWFLWSELTGLYEKFSFHLAGGVLETGNAVFSENEKPAGFQKTHFSKLSESELSEIKNIYSNFNELYFFTIKREEKDWAVIFEMDSIDLFIKKNELGNIEKYFCVNKGQDLVSIIHEIGCKPEKYVQLINQIKKYRVWLPESELSLSDSKNIFYMSFIKIGNKDLFNLFLNQITNGELTINEISQDQISFTFKDKNHLASLSEFSSYLFGPKPLVEFEKYLLVPYVTGCDSI